MTELDGRIALVTGGAGGVGSAVVELLARRGAVVYLNCFHSYPQGKEIAARLTAEGLDVRLARGSVTKPEHVESIMATIGREHGKLDILVNNAALGLFAPGLDLAEEDLDRVLAVNFLAPLRCVRTARSLLLASGSASVVNISSTGARMVLPDYLAIGVTKAALEAMTRYLAVELGPAGVRVNTASGGLLDTPGGRMFPGHESFARSIVDRTPLGHRIGEPDEFAELVAFLASPRSRWITGQTIDADGGVRLMCGSVSEPEPALLPEPAPVLEPVPVPLPEPEIGDPIVVVGMGLAVPGASSPDEFWQVLNDGPELFTEAPPERWVTAAFTPGRGDVPDKGSQPACGLITGFQPHPELAAEGLADNPATDFGLLWLRHSLHQALEQTTTRATDRFAFCVGLTADGSQHHSEAQVLAALSDALDGPLGQHLSAEDKAAIRARTRTRFRRGTGETADSLPPAIAAGAIRGILPEDSAVHVVDTACSSSLYALDRGVRELRAGRCEVAVCGGAAAMQVTYMVAFAKMGGLSPTGQVRSLDEDADGVLFADGAALVVLKKLSRAQADGDTVLGVLRGVGLSADGKGKAINAPASRGQVLAARRALAKAGTEPGEVDVVIAHATATPAGDSAELLGIAEVYPADRPLTVVSNKSVIGHTGWPAGVVSLIHLLLCLRHHEIPPQHRFTRLPAHLVEHAPMVRVPRQPVDWLPTGRARTGAVSAFGFGGTNATAVVSEYLPDQWQVQAREPVPRQRLAVVGWAAREPADGAAGFGPVYPIPDLPGVPLPKPVLRRIDRAQVLAIECWRLLPEPVRALCRTHRDTTGVLFGQLGQTGAMQGAQLRVHFDDLRDTVRDEVFLAGLRAELDRTWPEINADTQPGVMPNVIASRVANLADLHGLNLVVDGGEASLLQAFESAGCYLDGGELTLALVGGVSANPYRAGAEGAYLFAVTTPELARAWHVPVLAELDRAEAR
ncbi:SDR family oxidoreductase [Lentzea jiangxiensis]|uniref:Beta-ketoacyl synthase, N-terminal domain n=1 Tax=Lentzea jiangxiensis TaxID=641025 RepID=A0A1H0RVW3_9PSEU|nr:SDR family oxidoreductase [Lentzea jiangxiensis]SDP33553.1 Beta-ketoacyl synthase, N-terminal domain [Lentzea jiangxiensis]